MEENFTSKMRWAHANPKLSLWIAEFHVCEKFGQKPEGLFEDIIKTLFVFEYQSQLAKEEYKKLKKLENEVKR